jgi:hypothetical protein
LQPRQADESPAVCLLNPPAASDDALVRTAEHRHLHTIRFVALANLCLDSVRRAGLERFHMEREKKPLQHFRIVAFSDERPVSTPASAGAGIFLKML